MLWGIATGCTAAVHNYHSLLAARIFLGIFEAAIAPSLMLVSSQWYTKSEQAPRFSIWYCGLGVGQIVGGAVSYGFQHVEHASLAGWRIMFVVLGVVTVLIGASTLFTIPNSPMTAKFLNEVEKTALLQHISVNKTGVQNTHFKVSHIIEALMDIQVWLLILITMLISTSSGVITTYSATLIRNIGYTPRQAALLNMPSGIVSIFATLMVGFGVRKLASGHRWAWIVACCVSGILGGALMSFLPSSKMYANKSGLLAGVYLINFVVATLIVIYQWTASNIAGPPSEWYVWPRSVVHSVLATLLDLKRSRPRTHHSSFLPRLLSWRHKRQVRQSPACSSSITDMPIHRRREKMWHLTRSIWTRAIGII